MRIDVLKIVI